ncbi:SapC protein [Sphingomonas palmae]|uniref:SapC protein n=1 Tax=Sphingomonas palmae TaxID=1855283 RepID=A0A1H7M8W7_9SPHN|nr:SapC family protein [Sphingomonas palmae]SEL07613.1 SapC protein [Sphingomonas palmae]
MPAVLLNNVDHRDLRVAVGHHARYGDAINQTRVFPAEFEEAQREYAILLRRDDAGQFLAVVLLGLDADENLFLSGEQWDARYVPATRARGPFSIGVDADGEPMIHVEDDHPRIDANGAPVFREHGGNAALLDHVSAMLQRIYTGLQDEQALYAALSDAGLLTPATLQLEVGEGRRYNLPDHWTVDAERLAALGGDALARLHRADHLRAAVWIASSLGNVRHLIDRKLRAELHG